MTLAIVAWGELFKALAVFAGCYLIAWVAAFFMVKWAIKQKDRNNE